MAKKKTVRKRAPRKSSAAGNKSSAAGTTIQRGGEEFRLEKSKDSFVVRRTTPRSGTALAATTRSPDLFPGLKHDPEGSARGVELYHVKPAALDKAMNELRNNSADVAWCSHVYHMPADPNGLMTPYDDIYIELKPDFDESKINKFLDEHALELIPEDQDTPTIFRVRLTSSLEGKPH